MPESQAKFEVSVLPVFDIPARDRLFQIGGRKKPVQNKPFQIGVRIRNEGMNVFPGGVISNILLVWQGGTTPVEFKIPKEFHVKVLNPGESVILWLDRMETFLCGIFMVSGNIKVDEADAIVEFFQFDHLGDGNGIPRKQDRGVNRWWDFFLVQDQNVIVQSWISIVVTVFTVLTFLEATVDIKWFLHQLIGALIHVYQFLIAALTLILENTS